MTSSLNQALSVEVPDREVLSIQDVEVLPVSDAAVNDLEEVAVVRVFRRSVLVDDLVHRVGPLSVEDHVFDASVRSTVVLQERSLVAFPEEVEGTFPNLRDSVKQALRPVQSHGVPVFSADLNELLANWLADLTDESGGVLTPEHFWLHLTKHVLGGLDHPLVVLVVLAVVHREQR